LAKPEWRFAFDVRRVVVGVQVEIGHPPGKLVAAANQGKRANVSVQRS
jgi:hypothetical protein